MTQNIIMADNDQKFSGRVANLLADSSFNIETVTNSSTSAEALNKLFIEGKKLPSFLLVDLSLPDLDGVEFLSTLASEGNLCTVVAISADFDDFELGCFLRTPVVTVINKTSPETFARDFINFLENQSVHPPNGQSIIETDSSGDLHLDIETSEVFQSG